MWCCIYTEQAYAVRENKMIAIKRKKYSRHFDRRFYEQQPPKGAAASIRLWLAIVAR
jgi:hypothetical protein